MWPFKKKPEPIKLECPTCKQTLENYSEKRFKCPYCKNWIYFWDNRLLTKENKERLEAEYYQQCEQDRIRKYFMEKLELNESLFKDRENNLMKIAGGVKPKEVTVIMSLFNERVLKDSDLRKIHQQYYYLACYLVKKDEDPFHILKARCLTELAIIKKDKFSSVSIMSHNGCDACRNLDEKVFTIAEAKKKMLLPIRECNNKQEGESFPICVCSYCGEPDEAYLDRICK